MLIGRDELLVSSLTAAEQFWMDSVKVKEVQSSAPSAENLGLTLITKYTVSYRVVHQGCDIWTDVLQPPFPCVSPCLWWMSQYVVHVVLSMSVATTAPQSVFKREAGHRQRSVTKDPLRVTTSLNSLHRR
jgi:hypothetical protein